MILILICFCCIYYGLLIKGNKISVTNDHVDRFKMNANETLCTIYREFQRSCEFVHYCKMRISCFCVRRISQEMGQKYA